MSFYNPLPSSIQGSNPDYEENDGLSGRTTRPLNKPEPNTLHSTTRSGHASQIESTKRARSPSFSDTTSSYESSDDGILDPIIPPPNLNNLLCLHVRRAKLHPKPYKRDDLNVQRSKQTLERHLRSLSSKAVAQALIAKNADVEWRRQCAMTTAWEIHAREEQLKFLTMVLEDQCETYANAASEHLDTTIGELVRCSERELKNGIASGVAAFSYDVDAFSVGDAQFNHLESVATAILDNSDVTSCGISGNSVDDDALMAEVTII